MRLFFALCLVASSRAGELSAPSSSVGDFASVPCPLRPELCLSAVPASTRALMRRRTTHSGGVGTSDLPLNETLVYLRQLLQETIEVEHSTIPLYLTSMFSIANASALAVSTLHSVVIEEMLHMTAACNMLNAVGGAPAIDTPSFVPIYPLQLPEINVTASIHYFDKQAVRNFMLIESTTRLAKSISACYEYLLSVVTALVEQYGEPAVFTGNFSFQVEASAMGSSGLQTARKISNLSTATEALLGVSDQGGGCPEPGEEQLWPDVSNISAGPLGGSLSHYARFSQVLYGREYGPHDHVAGAAFPPTGASAPTNWSNVFTFAPNPRVCDFPEGSTAHTLALAFASNYTALLAQLHNVFNGAPQDYFQTLGGMHALTGYAQTLLHTNDPRNARLGVGPTWEYVPAVSRFAARGMKARPIV